MQFNSYIFILAFLPAVVLAYYTLGKVGPLWRKLVLVLAGFAFYLYAGIAQLWVLVFSLVLNYGFARFISGKQWRKGFTAIPIAINIALLLYYKYTNFAIENINLLFGTSFATMSLVLPLGISFFTFQQIAYLVAVNRGEVASPSILDYLAYILYFPKLVMGPLMEPADYFSQLNAPDSGKLNLTHIACGIKTFSFGLFKKALLADTFASAVNWGFANMATATAADWLLIMLFYTFQIYFDFSGYSDMAVGASLMLNITLPINFDSPYQAVSIRDFWKRWHISLTKFFTKYIYIPLGGSRKGLALTCLNTMLVFLISGLWHGANWTFLLWGLLHGLLSVLERLTEKWNRHIPKPLGWIITFVLINILWLLFRADSIASWVSILKTVFAMESMTISDGIQALFYLPEQRLLQSIVQSAYYIFSMIPSFGMVLMVGASAFICLALKNNYRTLHKLSWSNLVFSVMAMVWGILCLGGESTFVYFNF